MLQSMAGWIAPAATMLGACLTAANLGARVTGWGFVVFTVGALGWIVVAVTSGQQNLLYSNLFLLLVDIVGIWRWLGRRARYDDGARAATVASAAAPTRPTLFALGGLEGKAVHGRDGAGIATVVDAMATCDDGAIAYLVVREGGVGGIGERLHALDWGSARIAGDAVLTELDAVTLAALPELAVDNWPTEAARA